MFLARLLFRLFYGWKINRMTPEQQAAFFAYNDFRREMLPKNMKHYKHK
jgi:hypothetical protein